MPGDLRECDGDNKGLKYCEELMTNFTTAYGEEKFDVLCVNHEYTYGGESYKKEECVPEKFCGVKETFSWGTTVHVQCPTLEGLITLIILGGLFIFGCPIVWCCIKKCCCKSK